MHIIFFHCTVFLLFKFADAKLQHHSGPNIRRTEVNTKEIVFGDVIKNITRVNHVLEELIHNYEKLRTLYKSQETLAEYSSDGEIDELYKQKRAQEMRIGKTFKWTTRDPNQPATEMFFSDEKGNEDDTSIENKNNISSTRNATKSKGKNSAKKPTGNIQTNGPKIRAKTFYFNLPNRTPNIELLVNADNKKNVITKIEPPKKIHTRAKADNDKHKSSVSKSDERSQESTSSHDSMYVPARSSVKNAASSTSKSEANNSNNEDSQENSSSEEAVVIGPNKTVKENQKVRMNNESQFRTVKQVMKAEEFSYNNIWDEIVNKPIKLRTETELLYKQPRVFFRHRMQSDEPKRGTKDLEPRTVHHITKKSEAKQRDLSPESIEADKNIMKEMFKTRILRKAYGDACLKVVVKKCYKAAKKALKNGCQNYKCKSKFKNLFEQFSRSSCIKEFREASGATEELPKIVAPPIHDNVTQHVNRVTDPVNTEFRDITRSGYLAAACLPTAKSAQLRTNANASHTEVQLNILRDRFERECQKASSEKCQNACEYALKQTVAAQECSNTKKNAIKKCCRKECKRAYRYSSRHKSSGSSDSDSGSSGSSDSDSRSSSGSTSLSEEDIPNKKTIYINKAEKSGDTKHSKEKDNTEPMKLMAKEEKPERIRDGNGTTSNDIQPQKTLSYIAKAPNNVSKIEPRIDIASLRRKVKPNNANAVARNQTKL